MHGTQKKKTTFSQYWLKFITCEIYYFTGYLADLELLNVICAKKTESFVEFEGSKCAS